MNVYSIDVPELFIHIGRRVWIQEQDRVNKMNCCVDESPCHKRKEGKVGKFPHRTIPMVASNGCHSVESHPLNATNVRNARSGILEYTIFCMLKDG
jgi:hypothetical protein